MFAWLANTWRVPELRKRLLFTAFILAMCRLGSWVPAPGVDSQTIEDYFNGQGGTVTWLRGEPVVRRKRRTTRRAPEAETEPTGEADEPAEEV